MLAKPTGLFTRNLICQVGCTWQSTQLWFQLCKGFVLSERLSDLIHRSNSYQIRSDGGCRTQAFYIDSILLNLYAPEKQAEILDTLKWSIARFSKDVTIDSTLLFKRKFDSIYKKLLTFKLVPQVLLLNDDNPVWHDFSHYKWNQLRVRNVLNYCQMLRDLSGVCV